MLKWCLRQSGVCPPELPREGRFLTLYANDVKEDLIMFKRDKDRHRICHSLKK